MNCVFLSPHFPPQYYHFCRQLKSAGARVLGIGDASYDRLAKDVKESLTEYYRVDQMTDYEQLLKACGYFTHKHGKIDRIDSLNEFWLATEARLRDDFNVYGVRTSEIGSIRKKSEMKECFQKAGVSIAPGAVVQTLAAARELIAQTGYPVVAKPNEGVGALDTYRLDSDEDLVSFFSKKPAVDYIIEQFVSGTIVSFDGLCNKEGQPVFWTAHRFSQGIMETVNEQRHISYYSLREIPLALEEAGRNCLQAFGVRERFFHIEFFEMVDGSFTALEVNMRPPGGYTTDMFNYACDLDIYRIWADLLVHDRKTISFDRKYHCCYASRKNGVPYVLADSEISDLYGREMCQTVSVPGVFSSALGERGFIFRTTELSHLQQIITDIHKTTR